MVDRETDVRADSDGVLADKLGAVPDDRGAHLGFLGKSGNRARVRTRGWPGEEAMMTAQDGGEKCCNLC